MAHTHHRYDACILLTEISNGVWHSWCALRYCLDPPTGKEANDTPRGGVLCVGTQVSVIKKFT